MTILTLYLITMLDSLFGLALFISVLASVGLICYLAHKLSGYGSDREWADALPFKKTVFTILIIGVLTATMLPTTKQAMLIAGGYYATNMEGVDKLPPNAVKAVNKFLEAYAIEEGETQ